MYTYIIIDDEPLIRRGTIKKLENYPEIVCIGQAANGQAGLELIQEKNPDFIITDMKMPVLDGSQLLPILSEKYPNKYIIVISGYKDFEYAQQALRANTIDYIVKPFSRESLWDVVDKTISQLKTQAILTEKLNTNESEKENLKYEYDRQLLRNILFDNGGSSSSISSEKLKHLLESCHYVLITINLREVLPEKALDEFLSMRNIEPCSVMITRENTENMGFLLFFFSPEKSEKFHAEILNVIGLLNLFFADYGIQSFYGISKVHSAISTLHQAFQETANALNQLTLLPAENYIFYESEHEQPFNPDWPKLELFLFMVESGRTEEVVEIFPELFHYFARTERCRLKDAKEYCLKISEILKQSLPQDVPVHKNTTVSLTILNNLNFVFSFSKLEEYFLQFFRNMSDVFGDAGYYTEKNIIDNVKTYINHHYEKDLTLEFIASLFHLNRSYLSSAFRTHTGIRFVDYVNRIRIDQAKELLKNTDKKNFQIAQAVGYENVKYFFRIFKKLEGITPEQFRFNITSS